MGKTDFAVSLVVSATVFITVALAKMVGCTLPVIAQRLHFDPAVMAGPLITTLVDAMSLMVYFQLTVHFVL